MNIHPSVYIADGAKVVGEDINIGKDSSVWYNSVIRCSHGESITIGARTNIQDLTTVHVGPGFSVTIGDGVTVGHNCLIHGCTIGDNTLIGMGSVIMDGARIGSNCIIGAGSLVTEGKEIPDGTMAMGIPAKVKREMTEADLEINREDIEKYIRNAKMHFAEE